MKRTALTRRAPLKARRSTPRRSERVRDHAYLAWVHALPCAARSFLGHVCEGPIEADHAGPRPLGRKCDDSEVIALCQLAHRQRHDYAGPFRALSRSDMRAWLDEQIELTQRADQLRRAAPPSGQPCSTTAASPPSP